MDWKKIRKTQICNEIIYGAIIIVCAFVGIIAEYIAFSGNAIFYVLNFDAVSMVIIQIQASVQTLSIALLALASAQMDRSFMGITYNDYHFNIKPVIFTQKRIIISTIVLLVTNVFLHMAEFYNLVTTIFIVVCILIVISVMQIYGVFADNTLTEDEIEQFLLGVAAAKNTKQTIDYIKRISKDWSVTVEKQSLSVFDRYSDVFSRLCINILCDENPLCRSAIQDAGTEILLAYSKVQGTTVKIRALSFLSKIYGDIASIIREKDKEALKNMKGHVWIFNESFYDLLEIFENASVGDLDKMLRWPYFIEDVILINFSLDYDPEKSYELNTLPEFATLMARCLSRRKNEEYSDYIWQYLITSDKLSISLPEAHNNEANILYQRIRRQYLLALIRYNMYDFVREHFYTKVARGAYYRQFTKDQAVLFLLVHCYAIYLSEYEDLQFVTESEKKICKSFLENPIVKNCALAMFTRIGEEEYDSIWGGKVYTPNLIDEVFEYLRRFEILPSGEAKMMIMDTVVMDVVSFAAALASSQLNVHIVQNIISDNKAFTFYSRYIQNSGVFSLLNRFLELLGINTEKTEEVLAILQNEISKSVKTTEIKRAHDDHQKYLTTIDEKTLKQDIAADLLKHLNEKFSSFISEEAKEQGIIHMHLLSVNDFSSSDISASIKQCYNHIESELVRQLAFYLKKMGSLILHNRGEFSNDAEYLEFLNNSYCDEILGSDFVFRSVDYKNRSQIKGFFEGKKLETIDSSRVGIMTRENGFRFWIQKIRIGFHSGIMSEQKYTYEDGKYYHEVSSGVRIEFTQEELKQYIHERRIVVDVVVDVSLFRKEGIIGQILQEKYYN